MSKADSAVIQPEFTTKLLPVPVAYAGGDLVMAWYPQLPGFHLLARELVLLDTLGDSRSEAIE